MLKNLTTMLSLLPDRLLEVKTQCNRVVCIIAFLNASFMYPCLPNFQVTVHKINEFLNVMTENRMEVLMSSDSLAMKFMCNHVQSGRRSPVQKR